MRIAKSKQVRRLRTSEAARRQPVVGVKKTTGAVSSEVSGGGAAGCAFRSPYDFVTRSADRLKYIHGLISFSLGVLLLVGMSGSPELGTSWSRGSAIAQYLVHGVLIERPRADAVQDVVLGPMRKHSEHWQHR
jgi:hypothetical protein